MNLLASTILAAFVSFGPCGAVTAPDVSADLAAQGRAFAFPPADQSDTLSFELIDANGDAVITPDELGEWFVSDDPAVDAFDVFDTDLDGVVTPEEFAAMCFEPDDTLDV